MKINLVETLTSKEKRVYDLLCANLNNEEISLEVDLHVSGVKYTLQSIYHKLGVSAHNTSDKHTCRQRAITYGGTKIEEIYQSKGESFTQEEILKASKLLHWYDSTRVEEILEDLFAVLENAKKGKTL